MMKQLNLQKLRMVKPTKKVLQQLMKAQDLKRALRMKQMMMKRLNLQKLRKQTRMVKPTKKVLQQLMKAQDLCQIQQTCRIGNFVLVKSVTKFLKTRRMCLIICQESTQLLLKHQAFPPHLSIQWTLR